MQASREVTPLPFIWIALSGRGTVVKVHTETGAILGEYLTAPEGCGRNPSRTTVDLDGNVWGGNRDEAADDKRSVVHIGLQEAFNCADRNGNSQIDTSKGLGDVRPWPNTGGADNNGGVSTAQDECIIDYLRVNGTNVRTLAVDKQNNIWIGGLGNQVHDLVDGETKAILNPIRPACGGYGGLIDKFGVLWSTRGADRLLRYDPKPDNPQCLPVPNTYGLAVDSRSRLWTTQWTNNTVTQISPAGDVLRTASTGGDTARGVAVTKDDNTWIANSVSNTVTRLDSEGNLLATIAVGATPTGVAVDSKGKVWAANLDSHNAVRIDPATNQVDLTVAFGDGAFPYNHSDMTGAVLLGTVRIGKWMFVHDSGARGTKWDRLAWNGETPEDTSLELRVRSAESTAALGSKLWVDATNDVAFNNVPPGRYLQVEARFAGADSGASPSLLLLSVLHQCPASR